MGDNKPKEYAFVLQHCHKELQANLKNHEACVGIDDTRSVVCLLILIRDFQYNKLDHKRSIMATVKADSNLYSYAQGEKTVDKYYKVFSSAVDTINANGRSVGLYPSVFKK